MSLLQIALLSSIKRERAKIRNIRTGPRDLTAPSPGQ